MIVGTTGILWSNAEAADGGGRISNRSVMPMATQPLNSAQERFKGPLVRYF